MQSVVVVLKGRVVYEFYRDGAPDQLRHPGRARRKSLSLETLEPRQMLTVTADDGTGDVARAFNYPPAFQPARPACQTPSQISAASAGGTADRTAARDAPGVRCRHRAKNQAACGLLPGRHRCQNRVPTA